MAGGRSRPWLRRLKRCLLVSVGALLVLFLGLQILLATPWLKHWIAGKVSQRTGLEVSLGGLGWTPWGGGVIRDLRVEQPEGIREHTEQLLMEVGEIRVYPDYGACLRKQWRVRSIKIDSPELAISLEMLASIAASRLAAVEPPVVAAVNPTPGPPKVPLPAQPGQATKPGGQGKVAESTEGVTEGSQNPQVLTPPKRLEDQGKKHPFELKVSNANISLISVRQPGVVLGIKGVEMELPVGARDRAGTASVAHVVLLDSLIETDVQMELIAAGRVLNVLIKNSSEKNRQLTGGLALKVERGIPFQAAVGYRSSSALEWSTSQLGSVQIEENQTNVQVAGFGLVPMSWRGLLRFEGEGIRLEDRAVEFDRYGGSVALQIGVLQIPDVRLLGDQVALLGNGWVNRDAGAGVVRLVVPDQASEFVGRRLGVAEMEILEPGDRRYVDVNFWRSPGEWMAEFGEKSVPVRELWSGESP